MRSDREHAKQVRCWPEMARHVASAEVEAMLLLQEASSLQMMDASRRPQDCCDWTIAVQPERVVR